MNLQAKKRLRREFFARAGVNVKTFAEMAEGLPNVGFYILDADCRIIAINRFNRTYCNFSTELEAIGRTCLEAFPGKRGEIYTQVHNQVRTSGKFVFNRDSIVPADNSLTPLDSRIDPICDRDGRRIGTICVYTAGPTSAEPPQWHGDFRELTKWLHEHYREKISLPGLAKRVGMSPATFYPRFKALFGQTPGEYLISIRLNAARRLLENPRPSLADIAAETGFCDQSHFTKTFREKRGLTPLQYRRQHLQGTGTGRSRCSTMPSANGVANRTSAPASISTPPTTSRRG